MFDSVFSYVTLSTLRPATFLPRAEKGESRERKKERKKERKRETGKKGRKKETNKVC